MTPPLSAAAIAPTGFALAAGETAADRRAAMTHDLLAAAGADRGLKWTDPGRPAARAVQTIEDGREARVALGELPTVTGDRQQLGQPFRNLIGNAARFVPDDRVAEADVTSERDGKGWTVTVADNGIGVDAGHAERLFRVFQRLRRRDEDPRMGIGLAIAKKVVDRHGGRIRAEPRPGGGSCFRLTLPAPRSAP